MTGGLIQQKKFRLVSNGARDREALALPAGEAPPSLIDAGLVTHRHFEDVGVNFGNLRSCHKIALGHIRIVKRDTDLKLAWSDRSCMEPSE